MQYYKDPKVIKLKNGNELTVRRPKAEDARKLLEYLKKVGGETDNLLFDEGDMSLTVEEEIGYIERANSEEGSLLLVGVIGGNIVSVCNIKSQPQKRIAHNSEVGISVLKAYWRQGIGEAMFSELLSFAQAHEDISIVSLGVRAQNHGAIKLYKKLGFKKIGLRKNFFNINGSYDDEIIMDLHLVKQE